MWNYMWSHEGFAGVIGFDEDGNFHPEETQIHSNYEKGKNYTPSDMLPGRWEFLKKYLVNFANRIIDEEGWDTPHLTMDDLIHPDEV